MSKLRIFAAFALITISLLAVGVDFFVVGGPVGDSATDYLVKTGFEAP